MARTKKPCTVDGCERRKTPGSTKWCYWHWLDRQSTTDQVAAAATRLRKSPSPAGTPHNPHPLYPLDETDAWCLDCQSVVPKWYMHNGRRCRADEKARVHGKHLEKTYGVTADQYLEKLTEQGGKCAICRGTPRSKRLAQDHDHVTGEPRGLLCSRCNHDLLGAAHDSIEILERAVEYLRQYSSPERITAEGLRASVSPVAGCSDDPPF